MNRLLWVTLGLTWIVSFGCLPVGVGELVPKLIDAGVDDAGLTDAGVPDAGRADAGASHEPPPVDGGPTGPCARPDRPFGIEYFVASDAGGLGSGTVDRPFGSLTQARQVLEAYSADGGWPDGGIVFTLRGGLYWIAQSFGLVAAHSGTAASPVIWRACPGEEPRWNGGQRVTGWQKVDAADPNWARIHASANLYRAPISVAATAGTAGQGPELFVDGRRMQVARWPKAPAFAGFTESGATLTSSTPLPNHGWSVASALPKANQPWAYASTNAYADETVRIIGVSGDSVVLEHPTATIDPVQALWYAANLLEELTDPGEYWVDQVAGYVYLRPPDDLDPGTSGAETILSTLNDPLVSLGDTSSHVEFEGITFEGGMVAAVDVHGSSHVFRRCTFRNSNSGLTVWGTSITVEHSQVYAMRLEGITSTGQNPWGPTSQSAVFSDDDIHDVGLLLRNGYGGINLGGNGHWVHHNQIHHLAATAVWLGAFDSLIELNEFFDTQQVGGDEGALYGGGTNTNTEIRYNYFHDVPRPPAPWYFQRAGVYLDTDPVPGASLASGYYVHGNIFHRYGDGAATDPYLATAAILNKGKDNVFENNLFVRVDKPYVAGYLGLDSGTVLYNQQWLTAYPLPAAECTVQDPGFIDEAGGNLANRPDGSLVLSGGTESIPFSSIGPRP